MIERPIYARVCKSGKEYNLALKALDALQPKYPIEVILKTWKPRRSDQANRYLFGVCYAIISQETGNEVNDLHEYYLGQFFGWDEYMVMGKKKVRPIERSSKQIKARFSELIEFVIAHAATLGIVIPQPNSDLPDSLKGE
jgi:hypothetical protein